VKPFVAKAWARGHEGADTPRIRCDGSSSCWLRAGHGVLGLSRAIALSCNAYFRALASATEEGLLAATLRDEGFLVPTPLRADVALGLDRDGAVAMLPDALLRAYVRLTREPWREGDPTRREVLSGLRDNAMSGTARGLARHGLWAKTGTIPAIDGGALGTSGLIVAVDDAGSAVLALLPRGTGREAARALAAAQAMGPVSAVNASSTSGAARVSVALFGAMRPASVTAHNPGPHPLSTSRGYLGPGGSTSLRPGDRLSEGRWLLSVPGLRLRREVVASLACAADSGGALSLRAEMTMPEYVLGVLHAELPGASGPRREALAAAVLRFLADGPRHGATDVCDSTHCAWFIGRGPAVSWPSPKTPVLLASRGREGREGTPFDAVAWDAVVRRAREAGPRQWTSHCGGRPLAAHALWGNGDSRVWACDRHHEPSRPWTRTWDDATVDAAFGASVRSLAIRGANGVWTLVVETAVGASAYSYDDAHRRLAAKLGWAALPSPADTVVRAPRGWRAEGVGLGHRVGLCLGDEGR
jgi:stage II sporulation protein D